MWKSNKIHRKAVKTQHPLHWEKKRYLRNQVIDELRVSPHNVNENNTAQINKSIPPEQ